MNLVLKSPIILIIYVIFLRSRPKYTGRIDGSTGSNQMAKYYKNCLKFAKDLKDKNNFNIVPRLHEAQFEWNHINIWRNNNFNKFSFTDKESLDQVYKNYELLIYSYIGTGFLEFYCIEQTVYINFLFTRMAT